MKIIEKLKLLPRARSQSGLGPYMIVLHHTAGGTLSGAEATLKQRKLGYHFMIDTDGQVYKYAGIDEQMNHAAGYNHRTVGIAFVGGGAAGPINEGQIHELIALINEEIKPKAGAALKYITGHKHCSKSGKIDPRFPGEPAGGVKPKIDEKFMTEIAHATGLVFRKFD